MRYEEKDHLIIRNGSKNVLIQVTGKKIGIRPDVVADDADTYQFSKLDILCNLGQTPEHGLSVMGCTYNPLNFVDACDGLPQAYLFGDKSLLKNINKAMIRVAKKIEKNGFTESISRCKRISFVQKAGKATHKFSSKFQKEEWQDQIVVYVQEGMLVEDIEMHLLMAVAESVYTHQMNIRREIKWIVLFKKMRNEKRLDSTVMDQLYKDLCDQKDVTDVKNVVSEELLPYIDQAFKMIAKQNLISVRELEKLVSEPEKLREMFPQEIVISNGQPHLEKSVLRSVRSMFSWAVTNHLLGTDVGKSLTKAVNNTLKEL